MYADPAGVAAYAARADTPFGSLGSLLMLGGGWNAQTVPAGYGGGWSVLWLAFVIAAAAAYLAFGLRSRRWPGLGLAAAAGLVIAGIGVTGPGRDLLRALTSLWPGAAILRDGQQFMAPLALAEASGRPAGGLGGAPGPLAGRRPGWDARPGARPGQPGWPARTGPGPRQTAGCAAGPGWACVALLLAPVVLLPGLAWGAAGRLRPVWYPAGWLAAARLIDLARPRAACCCCPGRRTAARPGTAGGPCWTPGRGCCAAGDLERRPPGRRVVMQPDDPAARGWAPRSAAATGR